MDEELTKSIREAFKLQDTDPGQYSPLVLAYIGDNIYELVNRTLAVGKGNKQVQKLHLECSGRASAKTQARIALFLEQEFSEEEAAVFRRGRNAEVYTKAKNASITEYHLATGLEAVIGWLYLKGQYERLTALLKAGFETLKLI